ncbi:hypothetical protein [Chromobacterium violaceum]|uniref:hypothetical protein n=1 Tax=Chromobacterium violaceum TaxID=536 RepID=UPI001BE9CD86|nr:hypothetical protein [Chromobacterium violaceum]MBT2865901.1 hypothetical protein [Chromobacterium violaceum]
MAKEILKISTKTLSPASNRQDKKILVCKPPRIVIFFVGGAGDKRPFLGSGPNGNIVDVKKYFEDQFKREMSDFLINSVYVGYYEVHGNENIQRLATEFIIDKKAKVYIVGHSLGGWNGAHFSQKLSKLGYTVEMLITLDPVGESQVLKIFADIYAAVPEPIAYIWINLRYYQSYLSIIKKYYPGRKFNDMKVDLSANAVADAGIQWWIGPRLDGVKVPDRLPDLNKIVDVNHVETLPAMQYPLDGKITAWSILKGSIETNLEGV